MTGDVPRESLKAGLILEFDFEPSLLFQLSLQGFELSPLIEVMDYLVESSPLLSTCGAKILLFDLLENLLAVWKPSPTILTDNNQTSHVGYL